MAKQLYLLDASAPQALISCSVKMKSQAFNTSNVRLKKSGGIDIPVSRTGKQGETFGSGDISLVPVGNTQLALDSKLIFIHTLDLGFATDQDWMQILKAATKKEKKEKFEAFVKLVQGEKWPEVFDILKVTVSYFLEGGINGNETFTIDTDDVLDFSDDGLMIILLKVIELTIP